MTMQTLLNFLSQPVVIAVLVVVILLVLSRIARMFQRRRALAAIEKMPITQIPDPGETDLKAYDEIRRLRVEIWDGWEQTRDFSPKAFNDLLINIVKPIAAVYHPDITDPHFKASVTDLVHLNNRVFNRIRKILEKPFLTQLNRLDLETILALTRGINVVMKNPLAKVIRNKEVRKYYRQVFSALNIFNPWYWFRRIVFEYSLDLAIRYFITSFITIVGEEAVLLYGKNEPKNEREISQRILMLTMIHLMNAYGSPAAGELEVFYQSLISSSSLEATEKMEMINKLQKGEKIAENDRDYRAVSDPELRSTLVNTLHELAAHSNTGKRDKKSTISAMEDYYSIETGTGER